jgi:hypothetical protein
VEPLVEYVKKPQWRIDIFIPDQEQKSVQRPRAKVLADDWDGVEQPKEELSEQHTGVKCAH